MQGLRGGLGGGPSDGEKVWARDVSVIDPSQVRKRDSRPRTKVRALELEERFGGVSAGGNQFKRSLKASSGHVCKGEESCVKGENGRMGLGVTSRAGVAGGN